MKLYTNKHLIVKIFLQFTLEFTLTLVVVLDKLLRVYSVKI